MSVWKDNIAKVFHGLAIGQGSDCKRMADRLLTGTPKTFFNTAVNTHATARRVRRACAAAGDATCQAIEAETLKDSMSNKVVSWHFVRC